MPIAQKRKLKRTAKKRSYGKKRTGAYVFETLSKIRKKHMGK